MARPGRRSTTSANLLSKSVHLGAQHKLDQFRTTPPDSGRARNRCSDPYRGRSRPRRSCRSRRAPPRLPRRGKRPSLPSNVASHDQTAHRGFLADRVRKLPSHHGQPGPEPVSASPFEDFCSRVKAEAQSVADGKPECLRDIAGRDGAGVSLLDFGPSGCSLGLASGPPPKRSFHAEHWSATRRPLGRRRVLSRSERLRRR